MVGCGRKQRRTGSKLQPPFTTGVRVPGTCVIVLLGGRSKGDQAPPPRMQGCHIPHESQPPGPQHWARRSEAPRGEVAAEDRARACTMTDMQLDLVLVLVPRRGHPRVESGTLKQALYKHSRTHASSTTHPTHFYKSVDWHRLTSAARRDEVAGPPRASPAPLDPHIAHRRVFRTTGNVSRNTGSPPGTTLCDSCPAAAPAARGRANSTPETCREAREKA